MSRGSHFWPSLYARLAPSRYAEDPARAEVEGFGEEAFFTDFNTLRRHVEIELQSLLNAVCWESRVLWPLIEARGGVTLPRELYPLAEHPDVRASIVNYGLPAVIGSSIWQMTAGEVERRLREAVMAYEPRIRPETMRVRVLSRRDDRIDQDRALEFQIEGEIRGAGASLGITIKSVWDPQRANTTVEVGR